MRTFIIGFHDGWMHHPVSVVESESVPILASVDSDWYVEFDSGDFGYMEDNGIEPLEYIVDLAYDGQLTDITGKHEPFMDGVPRWDTPDILRMYEQRREFCNRHGGGWGCDPTCVDCTDDDGKPRPRGIGG